MYVDGFNLYHALDDLDRPHLKWVDLWHLSTVLVGKSQKLVRVVWCSAPPKNPQRLVRHRLYRRALEGKGVKYVEGHFVKDEVRCPLCGQTHSKPLEKQGDINVAVELIADAYEDVFDIAYLISGDSDQAGTARLFKEKFLKAAKPKRFITVAPPGRSHSFHIHALSDGKRAIYDQTVEACLFNKTTMDADGNSITRPMEYDPPAGWVRPVPKVIA